MITPTFKLSQTPTHLTAKIHCPNISPEEVELHTSNNHFSLFVEPFFLRLELPGSVVESDNEAQASYEASSGELEVTVRKAAEGLWNGLDNLEGMLGVGEKGEMIPGTVPEGAKGLPRLMKGGEGEAARLLELKKEREIFLAAEANSWRLPQSMPSASGAEATPQAKSESAPYGFLSIHSSLLPAGIHGDLNDLGPAGESLSVEERMQKCAEREEAKFDAGQYQGDFVYDDEIQELIRWKAPWAEASAAGPQSDDAFFTEDEKMTLASLETNDTLPFLSGLKPTLWHSLLVILFATAYDTRSTMADPTPESAWTIISLTPLFTALLPSEAYPTVHSALRASYRRALAFPLYRHWALCEAVKADVVALLKSGRQAVLRVLLGLKAILGETADYAVLNTIWVNGLIALLHKSEPSNVDMILGFVASQLGGTALAKADIGWPLEALEAETREAEAEPMD